MIFKVKPGLVEEFEITLLMEHVQTELQFSVVCLDLANRQIQCVCMLVVLPDMNYRLTAGLSAIQGVKQFKVTQTVLIAAAYLGSLYKDDGLDQKQQPEGGDKIIGATAIIWNCVIYTTNPKDFPQPYFKETGRHVLKYEKGGREVHIVGYLIEPDLEYTAGRHNHRIENEGMFQIAPSADLEEN